MEDDSGSEEEHVSAIVPSRSCQQPIICISDSDDEQHLTNPLHSDDPVLAALLNGDHDTDDEVKDVGVTVVCASKRRRLRRKNKDNKPVETVPQPLSHKEISALAEDSDVEKPFLADDSGEKTALAEETADKTACDDPDETKLEAEIKSDRTKLQNGILVPAMWNRMNRQKKSKEQRGKGKPKRAR